MKYLVTLLFLLPFYVFAQTVELKGQVFSDNSVPLQYVNVGIIGKPVGTVTNISGRFVLTLKKNDIETTDSLRISMIGFYAQSYSLSELIESNVNENVPLLIMLKSKDEQISEIVVSTKKAVAKTIGTDNKSVMNMAVKFSIAEYDNQNLGAEIGRRFNISKENTHVEKFRFYLSSNNYDSIVFRINVYEIKDGKPFRNLLKENVYCQIVDKSSGWVDVDLTPYELYVDNDIAVSVEWVDKSENGSSLYLPIVMPVWATHYYKFGSQNNWKTYRSMSSLMEIDVKY